jgi:hypothetical protein
MTSGNLHVNQIVNSRIAWEVIFEVAPRKAVNPVMCVR